MPTIKRHAFRFFSFPRDVSRQPSCWLHWEASVENELRRKLHRVSRHLHRGSSSAGIVFGDINHLNAPFSEEVVFVNNEIESNEFHCTGNYKTETEVSENISTAIKKFILRLELCYKNSTKIFHQYIKFAQKKTITNRSYTPIPFKIVRGLGNQRLPKPTEPGIIFNHNHFSPVTKSIKTFVWFVILNLEFEILLALISQNTWHAAVRRLYLLSIFLFLWLTFHNIGLFEIYPIIRFATLLFSGTETRSFWSHFETNWSSQPGILNSMLQRIIYSAYQPSNLNRGLVNSMNTELASEHQFKEQPTLLMSLQSLVSDIELEIAQEDFDLLLQLAPDNEQFFLHESSRVEGHLKHHGIVIQLSSFKFDHIIYASSSLSQKSLISFQIGVNKTVLLDCENLSSFGLSLLTLILLPSPENLRALSEVFKNCKLNNCLVDFIRGSGNNENVHQKIVLPMGWIYWLGIPMCFVREHGDIGQFVVSMGNKDGLKSVCKVPLWKRIRTATVSLVPTYDDEHDVKSFHDSSTEFLFLDSDKGAHNLMYIPRLSRKQHLVSLNAAGEAFGFGASLGGEIQKSIDHEMGKTALARGSIITFVDFIGINMRSKTWGHLTKRTEWLGRLFDARYIVPKGVNRGFLLASTMIGYGPSPAHVFENEDCMVSVETLKRRGVMQKDEGDHLVVLFPGDNGRFHMKLVISKEDIQFKDAEFGAKPYFKISERNCDTILSPASKIMNVSQSNNGGLYGCDLDIVSVCLG